MGVGVGGGVVEEVVVVLPPPPGDRGLCDRESGGLRVPKAGEGKDEAPRCRTRRWRRWRLKFVSTLLVWQQRLRSPLHAKLVGPQRQKRGDVVSSANAALLQGLSFLLG